MTAKAGPGRLDRVAPADGLVPVAVPESLLVPLLDTAGDVLRGLDHDDVPAVLRPLVGFDRRGLARGASRQALQKALDTEADFREAVVERFLERPEVITARDTWDPPETMDIVRNAARRDDLGLLASMLWAARPTGWEFGLGTVMAMADRVRQEQAERDDAAAVRTEIQGLEEARRRAEAQRRAAEEQVSRLERELKDERRSRRSREEEATREARAAEARADQLAAALERERASVEAIRDRSQREADRAREADKQLRIVRAEAEELRLSNDDLAERLARAPEPGSGLRSADVQALLDASEHAQRLSNGLSGVALHLRRAREAAAREAAQLDARKAAATPPPAPTRPARAPVAVPPGMLAEDPAAVEAMLRTKRVMLVVDGYNVSMKGWGDESVAVQRDRLLNACAALHARLRCAITLVFDGSDVAGVPVPRRPGVHVVFSASGEEADHVVVEGVKSLPPEVPVIVASSDKWVRDHSEPEGACVISNDALLRVLR